MTSGDKDVRALDALNQSPAGGEGLDPAKSCPTEDDLAEAITSATRAAVTELFASRPRDRFYYIALIATGDAAAPSLAAWSEELLAEHVKAVGENEASDLKWSYADSPLYPYAETCFQRVRELFAARPGPDGRDDAQWGKEVVLRMRAMERALAKLDEEGLFGVGKTRKRVVVNAEAMPPDETNAQRAVRLNPEGALREWLFEVAEEGEVLCEKCGRRMTYFEKGLSCGWECECGWGLVTTNPRRLGGSRPRVMDAYVDTDERSSLVHAAVKVAGHLNQAIGAVKRRLGAGKPVAKGLYPEDATTLRDELQAKGVRIRLVERERGRWR